MLAARTKRRRSAVDYARLARGDDDEVYPEENEPEERLEGPEEAAQGAPAVGRRSLIARRPKKGAVGRRSRSARLVMSDDSDDLLGVDEDASEDFVPGAVDSREEEDADAEEEEDEGPDAGDREDEDEGVDAGAREKEQESLKVVLRSRGSALESSSPRASRVALKRSLSQAEGSNSRRMEWSQPSSAMPRGAHGRLLKKIGYKAPLVAARAGKGAPLGPPGLRPATDAAAARQSPVQAGPVRSLGSPATLASGHLRSGRPGEGAARAGTLQSSSSGKYERRYTTLLDDTELFSRPLGGAEGAQAGGLPCTTSGEEGEGDAGGPGGRDEEDGGCGEGHDPGKSSEDGGCGEGHDPGKSSEVEDESLASSHEQGVVLSQQSHFQAEGLQRVHHLGPEQQSGPNISGCDEDVYKDTFVPMFQYD